MLRRREYIYPSEDELDEVLDTYSVEEFLDVIGVSERELFRLMFEEGYATRSDFPFIFLDKDTGYDDYLDDEDLEDEFS